MKQRLFVILLGLLMLLPGAAAQAQVNEVQVEPDQAQLVMLQPEGEPLLLRMEAPADAPMLWLLLYGAGDDLALELRDSESIPLTYQTQDLNGEGLLLQANLEAPGPYFLQISGQESAPRQPRYMRVEYHLAEPPLNIGQGLLLGEPMALVLQETFEDNQRGWWTGFQNNVLVEMLNGVLQMGFSGSAQALTGFDQLSGLDAPSALVNVPLGIGGDLTGAAFGLAFRVQDSQHFYLFQVDVNLGRWRVLQLQANAWSTLHDWQADARLLGATGLHTPGLWLLGENYLLLWDGQILGHVQDKAYQGGGLALYAEVPPGASAMPILTWDEVQIFRSTDVPPRVSFPQMALVQPPGDNPLAAPPQAFSQQLVGTWRWQNTEGTHSITLQLNADGSFVQAVVYGDDAAGSGAVSGKWYLADEATIVLEALDAPPLRYTPILSADGRSMILPQLDGQEFVRLLTE